MRIADEWQDDVLIKVTRITEFQFGNYVWYLTDPQTITYEEMEDGVIMNATMRILKEGSIDENAYDKNYLLKQ